MLTLASEERRFRGSGCILYIICGIDDKNAMNPTLRSTRHYTTSFGQMAGKITIDLLKIGGNRISTEGELPRHDVLLHLSGPPLISAPEISGSSRIDERKIRNAKEFLPIWAKPPIRHSYAVWNQGIWRVQQYEW
jgi:hypothetical protein